jgi:hypothetical protein
MDTIHVINLTPHPITHTGDGCVYPPSGEVARIKYAERYTVTIKCGVEIVSAPTILGVIGLPEPKPDTYLIVSRVVKNAVPDRDDCIVPDDLVRDSEGKVIGCRRFSL